MKDLQELDSRFSGDAGAPMTRAPAGQATQVEQAREVRKRNRRPGSRPPGRPKAIYNPADFDLDWILSRAMPVPHCGCYIWLEGLTNGGYGELRFLGLTEGAHRVAYRLAGGEIPAGHDLDHLCKVRSCINPAHLEPVTRQVNIQRSDAGAKVAADNLAKTHCPHGHPYAGDNLYVRPDGCRTCRECKRIRWHNGKTGARS